MSERVSVYDCLPTERHERGITVTQTEVQAIVDERNQWKQLADELADALTEKINMTGYAQPAHKMILTRYQRARVAR